MSETIDGLVIQTIPYYELDDYLIPDEIRDGVEPGEDLVGIATDPKQPLMRSLLSFPVIGNMIAGVFEIDQGIEWVATNQLVKTGDEVSIDAEEAVVETMDVRGEVRERVWVYEAVDQREQRTGR